MLLDMVAWVGGTEGQGRDRKQDLPRFPPSSYSMRLIYIIHSLSVEYDSIDSHLLTYLGVGHAEKTGQGQEENLGVNAHGSKDIRVS